MKDVAALDEAGDELAALGGAMDGVEQSPEPRAIVGVVGERATERRMLLAPVYGNTRGVRREERERRVGGGLVLGEVEADAADDLPRCTEAGDEIRRARDVLRHRLPRVAQH